MESSRDDSAAADFVRRFYPLGPEVGPRMVLATWDALPIAEQAAIAADWDFWVRSKQRLPDDGWHTHGFLTGRGFGKTISNSYWLNGEVEAGRARQICLLAQTEDDCVQIQVEGASGLIATASPWCRPVFVASDLEVVWPNGAKAYVRTPEVPGRIRGLEYDHTWMIELQSWPKTTMQEALDNVFLSTRLRACRVIWDCTRKKRHPLLKQLEAEAKADPRANRIVRGTTYENASNLGDGYVARLEKKFKGTTRGKEELLGEELEDSETATVKQAVIDAHRRRAPTALARRVVSIDPAVTDRAGSDTTGLVDVGLGTDEQAYVFEDRSGKYKPEAWGELALDWYVKKACDLIIAETNKGGQLVATNLRALAKERKLEVIVIGKDEPAPPRQVGKVFIREVYARGSKEDRAEPVGTAYERGRVSHVEGADLSSLENTLTTWEPAPNADSPGDLDALVHAVVEVLQLNSNEPDPRAGFPGIEAAQREIEAPPAQVPTTTSIFVDLYQGSDVDRI